MHFHFTWQTENEVSKWTWLYAASTLTTFWWKVYFNRYHMAAIFSKHRKDEFAIFWVEMYISREYLKMAVLFLWFQFHIQYISWHGFVIWLKTKAACGELPELPELKLPLSPSVLSQRPHQPSPSHQHDHKLLDFISKCFPASAADGSRAQQRKYFITFKLGQRIGAKFPVFCRWAVKPTPSLATVNRKLYCSMAYQQENICQNESAVNVPFQTFASWNLVSSKICCGCEHARRPAVSVAVCMIVIL